MQDRGWGETKGDWAHTTKVLRLYILTACYACYSALRNKKKGFECEYAAMRRSLLSFVTCSKHAYACITSQSINLQQLFRIISVHGPSIFLRELLDILIHLNILQKDAET